MQAQSFVLSQIDFPAGGETRTKKDIFLNDPKEENKYIYLSQIKTGIKTEMRKRNR